MPQVRLPMRKIREVLRLKAGGFAKRRIAASLFISATATVDLGEARLADDAPDTCCWRADVCRLRH
jgi:hypothetical protein